MFERWPITWFAPTFDSPQLSSASRDSLNWRMISSATIPTGAYQTSVSAVTTAMSVDGAAGRTLPNGMTVEMMHQTMVTEQVLHGWDLAVATDQDTELDSELVAMTHGIVSPAIDASLGADAYAPAVDVADHATAQQQLLALVGRAS